MTDVASPNPETSLSQLHEVERDQFKETLELFQERIAELELALEDTGWLRMTIAGEREFSREGLRKLCRIARLSFLKNPLINHAVRIQANYVWAQGANIFAQNQQVNTLVQKFMNDRRNLLELTGHQARILKEIELQIHGNLFLALFTNPSTGRVQVKPIPVDEIIDIVTDPDDASQPWFYKRSYSQQQWNPEQGEMSPVEVKYTYHPDWQVLYYSDFDRPANIAEWPVMWDAPVYHVRVGGFSDMRFGVPEIYSAIDWARAVKDDLSDYATLRRALARFAWQLSTKGGRAGVTAAKTKMGTTLNSDGAGQWETNPSPVTASTFVQAEGWNLQPIKTAGAAPSPDEGRRLWLMVAAGTGIPETILSGDADVGNMATAKTLDRPTELQMRSRQTLWADVYSDILGYVVDQAIQATRGPLKGTKITDAYTEQIEYTLDPSEAVDDKAMNDGEPADRTVDVTFPNILQRDMLPTVQAIVQAATLNNGQSAGLIDDRTLAKLLLSALGEDDIDERLAELFPENWLTTLAGKELPDDSKPNPTSPPSPPPNTPPNPNSDASQPPPPRGGVPPSSAPRAPAVAPGMTYDNRYESRRNEQLVFREALGEFRKLLSGMMLIPNPQQQAVESLPSEVTSTELTYDDKGRVVAVRETVGLANKLAEQGEGSAQ